MPDFRWVALDWEEALARLRKNKMDKLPISCQNYRYFGTSAYPELKLRVRAKQFYENTGDL